MPRASGLHYEIRGPENGSPLILSPGLGGSASYWRPNLDALSARHRVILYDHRGTARSDRSLPDEISVDDLADDIILLMDALDLPSCTLVGHAAGGLAGLALALKAPDRHMEILEEWRLRPPHA